MDINKSYSQKNHLISWRNVQLKSIQYLFFKLGRKLWFHLHLERIEIFILRELNIKFIWNERLGWHIREIFLK